MATFDVIRVRDQLKGWIPWWLSDRKLSTGKTVGFRVLWVLVMMLDVIAEWLLQGLQAAWPGQGTPTALAMIGRSRGIIRGESDTDDEYAAKLRVWLDKWAAAGSQRQLAIELHEYLTGHPMVRIVNRAGKWTTVAADGTITTAQAAFNWDGTSHPSRAGFWSECWIIIYPTPYALAANWGVGTWGDTDFGLGHEAPSVSVREIKGLIAQWKSAHTLIRAAIWTSDATLFDPAVPGSLPNGSWGDWQAPGTGAPSSRNLTTCRYWEPE